MAEIKLISLGALIEQENGSPKYKFFIPGYQRGYKWRETGSGKKLEKCMLVCPLDKL